MVSYSTMWNISIVLLVYCIIGTIPTILGKLSSISYMDLSANKFYGNAYMEVL